MSEPCRHRRLSLALILVAIGGLVACDTPVAPPPLSLNPSVASVDSLGCTYGYLVIQGVVSCLPGPG